MSLFNAAVFIILILYDLGFLYLKIPFSKSDMVSHTCDVNPWKAEMGKSWVYIESYTNQGNIARHCTKDQNS